MEKLIRFFDIGPETTRNANLIWPLVEARASDIIGDFYTGARKANVDISLSDQAIENFKVVQTRHWRRRFIARFDEKYYNEASLVGIAHREVGLDVRWYIAGCTKIKMGFVQLILGANLPLAMKANLTSALEKYVALNMAIAVSSYTSWLIDDRVEECGVDSRRGCDCPSCKRSS